MDVFSVFDSLTVTSNGVNRNGSGDDCGCFDRPRSGSPPTRDGEDCDSDP